MTRGAPDPRPSRRAPPRRGGTGAVDALLDAVPRVTALLDEAEALLARAGTALDRLEDTRTAADLVVRRADTVGDLVEGVVGRVDQVVAETLGRTGSVVVQAEQAVTTTETILGRVVRLVDSSEPSLVRLQPTLDRLAETTDPAEVDDD